MYMKQLRYICFFALLLLTSWSGELVGQGVAIDANNFPDENFRSYIMRNYDADYDGTLSTEEVADVTEIVVYGQGIKSLKGLEFFPEITWLDCDNNQLTELDLSHTTKLTELHCSRNQLSSIDVSLLTALTTLCCADNQLTTLDVSQNVELTLIECYINQLTELDLSHNVELTQLQCNNNQLTTLDLSNNKALYKLYCYSNQLTELDLSHNESLSWITCSNNQLRTLDISHNKQLRGLTCYRNLLSKAQMERIIEALPEKIDPFRGTLIVVSKEDGVGDANVCTKDQVSRAIAKGWDVYYHDGENKLPYEGADESYLLASTITMTTTAGVGDYIMLSVEGVGDIEIEGAELKFGGMAVVKSPQITIQGQVTSLDCSEAQLTALDLSQMPSLTSLWCSNNALTQLDTRSLPDLKILYCVGNQLSELDVSTNTKLTELDCSQNMLTQIDLTQCGSLTHFLAYHNQIESIDLGSNPLLIGVDLSENKLTEISVSSNTKLETIYCNGNAIKGQAMEQLVASLPDRNDRATLCHLFVVDTKNTNEQNVITKRQVQAARAKHWQSLDYSDGDNDGAGIPYEGVDDQEQSPFVRLSVNEDEEVSLKMLGIADDTEITIDPGNGTLSTYTIQKEGTGWNNFIKPIRVRALGSYMKIYGAIRHFDCSTNKSALTGLELGETPHLEVLMVENNPISSIDLSRVATLQEFSCKGSQTNSLQLPNSSSLKVLKCSGTPLTVLDLMQQVHLEQFVADRCESLKEVDFSSLSKLTYISMEATSLTEIDLTACKALQTINLGFGQLSSLQLSPTQTSLRDIRLKQSQLSACALDSIYTALPQVTERASILVEGNEGATTAHSDIATGKGWTIDVTGDGSGCSTTEPVYKPKDGTPYVMMTVTPNALIRLSFKVGVATDLYIETAPDVFIKETLEPIVGPTGGYGYTAMKKYRATGCSLRVYGDLLGIDCSENKEKLTSIDVDFMPKLQDLMCQENQIEELRLDRAESIQWLFCAKNRISKLDLTRLTQLEVLDCSENQLTKVKLPSSSRLVFVSIAKNQLDACAINELFASLPSQPEGLIKIGGNPEAEFSNPKLLADKGWRVDVLGDATGCPDDPNAIDALTLSKASIYPNPTSGLLNVCGASPHAEVRLYRLSGELLQRAVTDSAGYLQMDVSQLPNGIYQVIVGQSFYSVIVAH